MYSKGLRRNPNSIKPIFASNFLRALARINLHKPNSSYPSFRTILQRSRKIKLAAEASMASAVGSKKAWSRAVLQKLRSRRARTNAPIKPKVFISKMSKKKEAICATPREPSRANDLRRLVPGGEAMDFCSLLEEAADYILCLTTKVKVMQGIADSLSP
eukprot:TRINITY_DN770_c0_g2_i2.p1 TRINITY_DN770_c0_g2~~TRINITY_DN770_c0_g2_i2.p1  ORF type:complete len:159 (-),score=10.03 TRINITY_DN770_c0_g2_i2:163-639(-)